MFTNNSILKSHSLKPWHLYSYSMPYLCVKKNRVKDVNKSINNTD